MTTTFTNPETGAEVRVYVHEMFRIDGKLVAKVNKGEKQSPYTFIVAAQTLGTVI